MTTQVSKFALSPIPSIFNFISTTSNSSTPFQIRIPTIRLHSLSLSLSSSLQSSICITNSSKQHSFTVDYLINSCGLSPQDALEASTRVNFNIAKKPDIVLACFKNYGFPEPNISEIVKKYPRILLCNPAKTVSPKLDYLHSKGILVPELVEIITAEPAILKRSLKNLIVPCFNTLKELLNSDDEVIQTIKEFPFLLSQNPEVHNVEILREVGVSNSNILTFLSSRRRVCMPTAVNFRKILEEVEKLGFKPSSSSFIRAIQVIRSMRKSTWEKKVEAFKKWGWSKDQVLMAFLKHPKMMDQSEHKINRIMDFFVNKMGLKSSDIACRPAMMTLSLEKRIIPRSLVYQVMLEKGLFKNIRKVGLFSLLWLGETKFIDKILETCEGRAPEFLQLYQEILAVMQGNKEFDSIQSDFIQELVSDASCGEKIRFCLPYLNGSE